MTIKPARRPDLFVKTRVRFKLSSELVREIKAAMPEASDAQRQHFLIEIESAIRSYLYEAPRYEAFGRIGGELGDLEAAASSFAAAVRRLGPETLNRLRLGFGRNAKKAGATDLVGAADDSLTKLIGLGDIVRETAEIATRLLKEPSLRPRSRDDEKRKPMPGDAINHFVFEAACAYGNAFGYQARPTKTGTFAKLLPSILKEAGIEGSVGEDRLKKILDRKKLPGKAPKRGRKPSKSN